MCVTRRGQCATTRSALGKRYASTHLQCVILVKHDVQVLRELSNLVTEVTVRILCVRKAALCCITL